MAVRLLSFLSVSGLFITVALAYTGGLQGTGDTRSPFYISLVSQLIIPIWDLRRRLGVDEEISCVKTAADLMAVVHSGESVLPHLTGLFSDWSNA